jgi:D-glycerate 3-kinase
LLAKTLNQAPYLIRTTVLSIDDFYLPYHEQKRLATDYASNPLIQHRGQPSTHDLLLGAAVFSSLRDKRETGIPSYDKSAYNGQGDRISHEKWNTVNEDGEESIEVVIFEGWCVGFRALTAAELQTKWEQSVAEKEKVGYRGKLGFHRLADVEFVNEALRKYDVFTEYDRLGFH